MTAVSGVSPCQSDKNTMNEPPEAEAAAAAVQNSQTAHHVCCCNYFSYLRLPSYFFTWVVVVLFGFGLWGDTRPWFFRENLLSSYSKCIDCVSSIESLVAGFGIPRCLFVLVLVFIWVVVCVFVRFSVLAQCSRYFFIFTLYFLIISFRQPILKVKPFCNTSFHFSIPSPSRWNCFSPFCFISKKVTKSKGKNQSNLIHMSIFTTYMMYVCMCVLHSTQM